jgi:hypothetical protein
MIAARARSAKCSEENGDESDVARSISGGFFSWKFT